MIKGRVLGWGLMRSLLADKVAEVTTEAVLPPNAGALDLAAAADHGQQQLLPNTDPRVHTVIILYIRIRVVLRPQPSTVAA